jgi:hypothetical protein
MPVATLISWREVRGLLVHSCVVVRFVLDSDAVNDLDAHVEAKRQAIERHGSGVDVFVVTHIQVDQAAADRNPERRASKLDLLNRFDRRLTYGVVWDVSRWDAARFGERESIDPLRTRGRGEWTDALIGATAQYEEAVLVTGEVLLTRNRSDTISIPIKFS